MRRKQRQPEPDWDTIMRSLERNEGAVFSCPAPEPTKERWTDRVACGFWLVVNLVVMGWLLVHCPILFFAFLAVLIFSWP
jgi:hypothetical protein